MSEFSSLKRRLFGALGVASATAFILLSLSSVATAQPATTPSDWPVLQLANPNPGDVVANGDYIVSGTAYDPAAKQGAGVSRVDLFLGSRDEGGMFLGSAVPGQDLIPGADLDSRLAQTGFQIKVTMPTTTGGEDFYAYAYSSLTGKTTNVSMPIFLGVAPTPTPSTTTAVTRPSLETQQAMPVPMGQGAEMFSLANPGAGDVVLYGDYVISGATGSAIDRVQLFLDSREAGGAFLGTVEPENGSFTVKVTIPTTLSGGHNLVAYARSSATDVESQVATPIFIGAAPTPTPRPS
jgi:hypothetical protein